LSSFEDRVQEVLQSLFSDPSQLPPEVINAIPQIVAQNPVAEVATGIISYGTSNTSVSATGTTFATGTDVLSTPLSFTATGKDNYLLIVSAPVWNNGTASASSILSINLDGTDAGQIAQITESTSLTSQFSLYACGVIPTPSVGSHAVNARLIASAGTATIAAGAGGAGTRTPILVAVKRLAIND
jgi:hypothetical protein